MLADMPRRSGKPLTRAEKLLRSDGALCVTFVNTGSGKRESLDSYGDLLAWGVATRILADAESRRLAGAAAAHPAKAADVLRRAQTLRARLQRILLALAAGQKPAASDFNPFNADLRRVMAARQLAADASGYRWTWGEADDDLDRVLWPVLLSAAVVLASRARGRVRRCRQEDCDLLFVARNGGKQRKFCGLSCGSRSSTRTHYRRKVKPAREQLKQEQKARLEHARQTP
jgi:predicted RNA-binding Zn ribbon-like protein